MKNIFTGCAGLILFLFLFSPVTFAQNEIQDLYSRVLVLEKTENARKLESDARTMKFEQEIRNQLADQTLFSRAMVLGLGIGILAVLGAIYKAYQKVKKEVDSKAQALSEETQKRLDDKMREIGTEIHQIVSEKVASMVAAKKESVSGLVSQYENFIKAKSSKILVLSQSEERKQEIKSLLEDGFGFQNIQHAMWSRGMNLQATGAELIIINKFDKNDEEGILSDYLIEMTNNGVAILLYTDLGSKVLEGLRPRSNSSNFPATLPFRIMESLIFVEIHKKLIATP